MTLIISDGSSACKSVISSLSLDSDCLNTAGAQLEAPLYRKLNTEQSLSSKAWLMFLCQGEPGSDNNVPGAKGDPGNPGPPVRATRPDWVFTYLLFNCFFFLIPLFLILSFSISVFNTLLSLFPEPSFIQWIQLFIDVWTCRDNLDQTVEEARMESLETRWEFHYFQKYQFSPSQFPLSIFFFSR